MPAPRLLLASVLAGVLIVTSGCFLSDLNNMDKGPPTMSEEYSDLAAVYPVMEGLVAETITPIDDFPGFHTRTIATNVCYGGKHDLEEFPGTAQAQLAYGFAEDYWDDPAVRVDLPEAVKARWVELGYDVEDEATPDGAHRTITATADGEIFIRFRSLGVVLMDVYHTKCVESSSFDIVEPAGGVLPENERTDIEAGSGMR
jgi:hypothetical protein